jgi:uncharacterized membrane protein
MSTPLPSFVRHSQAWAVGSLLALVALGLAWELWIAPLRPGGSWWALKVLPLCFALPGLLRHRLYTYRWLSLLVWLYAIEALVRGTTEKLPGAALAWAELTLVMILFGACVWQVRGRLKAAATAPAP